jgi:NADPH:quinone reductase-like Zn-dependent oxidoreductase
LLAVSFTQAYVLEELGYRGLCLRERVVPDLRSHEVLVRMRAASVNFRDIKIIKGIYARKPVLPVVVLSDGAGDITAVGAEVRRFSKGDRVIPIYMSGWHHGPLSGRHSGWKGLGGDIDGTATKFAVFHEDDVVAIPDSLSYEEAACIPCAGVTAWHALVSSGQIKAGDDVLILGSGGVSIFGLQIALMSGARVLAISSDDEKLERLRDMGASVTVNYKTTLDWDQEIRIATGDTGVDHVLEVVGDSTMERSIRATAERGNIAVVGDLSGSFSKLNISERQICISTIAVGSRTMMEQLLRAITLHSRTPVIDRIFPFAKLREALVYLEQGSHVGKVVIKFD